MCGRFAQFSELSILMSRFNFFAEDQELFKSWNLAPSQVAHVIVFRDGERRLWPMKWGLIPFWSKEPSIGNRLINARVKTLSEKPAFRHAVKRRRCVIPADGFYEWRKVGKTKQPYFIHARNGLPLGLAGLWDCWNSPDASPLETFTIITAPADDPIRELHDRMPVILSDDGIDAWLDPGLENPGDVMRFLKPLSSETLELRPVSTLVNSPANDSPDCVKRAEVPRQTNLFND